MLAKVKFYFYLLINESVDCDFIKSSTLVLLTGCGVTDATVVTGVWETGGATVFGAVDEATVVIGFDVGAIFSA